MCCVTVKKYYIQIIIFKLAMDEIIKYIIYMLYN